MQKGRRLVPIGILLGTLATVGLAGELGVGLKAPKIDVAKWIKGKPVELGKGKVHVVEFWATWCGPCKVSIPHLTELQKKYGDKVGIVGVSIWEDPKATDNSHISKVEQFVREWAGKMEYTVAADGFEGTMAKSWMEASEGNGIPTAFIVGKDGTVLWIGHPMSGMDEALDQVLAGTYDLSAAKLKDKGRRESARASREVFGPITEAMKAGDTALALQRIDEAIAKNPKLEQNLGMTKFNLLLKSNPGAAMMQAKHLSEGAGKDNPNLLNALAWTIVDDKSQIQNPDYSLAVKIAERGVALVKETEAFYPYIADTLAYALFKTDQLDRALEMQAKALAAAEALKTFDAATLKEIKDRLEMFRAKKKAADGGG